MIFDEEYKDAEVHTVLRIDGDEVEKGARMSLCWNCNRATYWYSIGFMIAPICSKECLTQKWNEYAEAMRKT
jgi:hypothetical protein